MSFFFNYIAHHTQAAHTGTVYNFSILLSFGNYTLHTVRYANTSMRKWRRKNEKVWNMQNIFLYLIVPKYVQVQNHTNYINTYEFCEKLEKWNVICGDEVRIEMGNLLYSIFELAFVKISLCCVLLYSAEESINSVSMYYMYLHLYSVIIL